MSRLSAKGASTALLAIVVLSTTFAVAQAQDGGAAVMAATDAANADVHARALELERLLSAAAAAEAAARRSSRKGGGKDTTTTGKLGDFDPAVEENQLITGSTFEGDAYMATEVEDHFPVPTPTPGIEAGSVVWENCANEGELCDCGYQGSGGGGLYTRPLSPNTPISNFPPPPTRHALPRKKLK